jgi:hypothetical protein
VNDSDGVLTTSEVIASVLVDRPDVVRYLDEADEAAWSSEWSTSHRRLLELCRLRVAMLLDCPSELTTRTAGSSVDEATIADLPRWPTSARFDDVDRACLALCEQFVIDVASLPDDIAAQVSRHLGNDGLVNFVSALLVIEQRQRLRLAWSRLLGEHEVTP